MTDGGPFLIAVDMCFYVVETRVRSGRESEMRTRSRAIASKSHLLCDDSEEDEDDVMLEKTSEKENEGADGITASSGHEMDTDRLGRETCIGCVEGGKMLVCSVSDCPVAIHQKCLPAKPRFDDAGNFLCPYCWYKHEVTRALELKKKLMLTKKDLSGVGDFELGVNSNQQKPNDEGNGMDVGGRSVEADAGLESLEFEIVFDGDRREEAALQHNDDSRYINKEIPVGALPCSSTEGMFMTAKCKGSQDRTEAEEQAHPEAAGNKAPAVAHDSKLPEASNSGTVAPLEHRTHAKRMKALESHEFENVFDGAEEEQEEQAHPEAAGTEALALDSELSEASNSDTTPLVRRIRAKRMKTGFNVDLSKKSSPWPHRTSEKDAGNQRNKEISPKKKGKASEPSKQVDLVTFWNGKRNKLFWTAEEENMLKDGVQKYSTLVNKNLPWRKILVFGGHVFHSTRTPSDLKDKWKNMTKEKARS